MLDERAKILLKALVERYIADGQPVGSRTLSRASGLELSAATIRNVMADLEELGLIVSPHTSAGRVPTARGYRLFVDTMLTARALGLDSFGELGAEARDQLQPDQPQRVISNAQDYNPAQLVEASNFLTEHYSGLTIEEMRERLKREVDQLRTEIGSLMQAAVQAGSEVEAESQESVVVSGERNLLTVQDFSSDMGSLRRMFDLFEQKTQLMRLLDGSSRAEGVNIYIGGESQVVPFEELSVVSAPYQIDGRVVGTLGVIGPTRMAYDRMIEIVDITSRLVSNALSQK